MATDSAAAYSPALAAVLPGAAHEAGKRVQQRIERDHQHLKGRLGVTRGFKTLAGAWVLCAGHALLRNARGHFHDLPDWIGTATAPLGPSTARAWAVLTTALPAQHSVVAYLQPWLLRNGRRLIRPGTTQRNPGRAQPTGCHNVEPGRVLRLIGARTDSELMKAPTNHVAT